MAEINVMIYSFFVFFWSRYSVYNDIINVCTYNVIITIQLKVDLHKTLAQTVRQIIEYCLTENESTTTLKIRVIYQTMPHFLLTSA